jgi:hypothetical protein
MPLEEFEEKRKKGKKRRRGKKRRKGKKRKKGKKKKKGKKRNKGKKRIHCKFPRLYLEECMRRQKLEGGVGKN